MYQIPQLHKTLETLKEYIANGVSSKTIVDSLQHLGFGACLNKLP
jgi:hypothetical protein